MGRRVPLKVPTPTTNPSSKEARALKEASRMACSLAVVKSVEDMQRLAAAAVFRCCCSCSNLNCRYVVCNDRQLVLEVPVASALTLLQEGVAAVDGELTAALGLQQGSKACRPFLGWWWGPTLDFMQANRFRL